MGIYMLFTFLEKSLRNGFWNVILKDCNIVFSLQIDIQRMIQHIKDTTKDFVWCTVHCHKSFTGQDTTCSWFRRYMQYEQNFFNKYLSFVIFLRCKTKIRNYWSYMNSILTYFYYKEKKRRKDLRNISKSMN